MNHLQTIHEPLTYRIGILNNDRFWIERPDGRLLQIDTVSLNVLERLASHESIFTISKEMDVNEEEIDRLLEVLGVDQKQPFSLLKEQESVSSNDSCSHTNMKDSKDFYLPWLEQPWYKWGMMIAIVLSLIFMLQFIHNSSAILVTGLRDQWIVTGLLTLAVVIHELGHLLTMPHSKNNTITIQWTGPVPLFSIVCNDAWKLAKRERLRINMNGFIADLLVCGLVSSIGYFFEALAPWIWTFLIVQIFRMIFAMCPLLPGDGYWVLVDLFDQPNLWSNALAQLRQYKISWLSFYAALRILFNIVIWALFAYVLYRWITILSAIPFGETFKFFMYPAPLFLALTLLYQLFSMAGSVKKLVGHFQSSKRSNEFQNEKGL